MTNFKQIRHLTSELSGHLMSAEVISQKLSNETSHLDSLQLSLDILKNRLPNQGKITDIIRLNIGGQCVDLERKLLLREFVGNGFFALIFCGKFDSLLPKDKNGRIFLDIDPKWAMPQVNLMHDLAMWDGSEATRPILFPPNQRNVKLHKLLDEHLGGKISFGGCAETEKKIMLHSAILSEFKGVFPDAAQTVLNMLPKAPEKEEISTTLLYRGSRDGFKVSDFRSRCYDHPNTITVIRDTDGNIFGGFSDKTWNRENNEDFKSSQQAFLFSLKHGEDNTPVKLMIKERSNSKAVYCSPYDSHYFCCFGSHSDLIICNNCNLRNGSICKVGCHNSCYEAPPLIRPNFTSNVNREFTVSEMEVFAVEFTKSTAVATDITSTTSTPAEMATPSTTSVIGKRPFHDTETIVPATPSHSADSVSVFHTLTETASQLEHAIKNAETDLLRDALQFRNELRFVAKYVGMVLPVREESTVKQPNDFQETLVEIETLIAVLSAGHSQPPSSDIVYITVSGTKVAVCASTLLLAPSGSPLALMTSAAWGHAKTDSIDGDIVQSVNSELFAAIINHLRLRALLPPGEVPPSIVIYESQRNALNSLLAYYMLSEVVPVQTVGYVEAK